MTRTIARTARHNPLATALVLGLLCGLGFAPLFWWPLFIISFTGLVGLLRAAPTARRAAKLGWVFGFGYFAGGIWWLAHAFLFADSTLALVLAPMAIALLCAVLALSGAFACWGWWRWGRGAAVWLGPLVFALWWLGGEGLRSTLWYGFPWDLAGYALAGSALTLQPAALGGVWLLGFLLITLSAGFGHRYSALLGAVLFFGFMGWGMARLGHAGDVQLSHVTVRLVQANIPQDQKWAQATRMAVLMKHLALSSPHGDGATPNLILWPETAIPFFAGTSPELAAFLHHTVPAQSTLVAGEPRLDPATGHFYNSIMSYLPDGATHHYDKHILVPFGEFMPFRRYLPASIGRLVQGGEDFTPGTTPPDLVADGLHFLPLVCYEAIFPAYVARHSAGKTAIINLTNDAWFGDTPGPAQHFAMARVRAVETGLPLVRDANNGITAVTDGYGRITAALPRDVASALQTRIPKALETTTPFAFMLQYLYNTTHHYEN